MAGHPHRGNHIGDANDVQAAMYIVARMILGFGIVFCIVNGSAMLGELAYPRERPVMTSIFNSSWFVGSLIASGIVRTTLVLR